MADIKRTLEVEIRAVADKFAAGMGQATKSLSGFESSLGRSFGKFDEAKKGLENIGRAGTALQGPLLAGGAALTAFGAAGAGAFGLAGNAAKDFETAFTGVRKTVEASPAEFAALEEGIRKMSLEIPVAAEELANIGEIAGQLGVSKDGILDFTETIAALGVTTNLSTEEAAVGLARFINISDATQDEVENLGSSIVALGNNSATSEKEILNMATRMALAGTQAGLSSEEILAFSASLSSAGVSAELGGTNFSRFMSTVNSAVAAGGASLQQFATVAGMSAAEFKTAFETDAAGALTALLGKMGEFGAAGGDMAGLLDDLGFKGEEAQRAILALSTRTDSLTDSLNLSKTAFTENIALTKEAELRYATTESQMRIFVNTIKDIGISVGNVVLPALNDLLGALKPVLAGFADFAREHPTLITALTGIGAAGSAAALGLGGIAVAAGTVAGSISTLLPLLSGVGGISGAASVATAGLVTLGTTAATVAAGAAAAFAAWKLGEWAAANIPLVSALGDAIADLVQNAGLVDWITGVTAAEESLAHTTRGLAEALRKKGVIVKKDLFESMSQYRERLEEAAKQAGLLTTKTEKQSEKLSKAGKDTAELETKTKSWIKAMRDAATGAQGLDRDVFNLDRSLAAQNATASETERIAKAAAEALAVNMSGAAVDLKLDIEALSASTNAAMADIQAWTTTAADTWDATAMQAATTANEVEAAFGRMGVKTKGELESLAAQAASDFDKISGSGEASAQAVDQAWIKMLKARKEALIANGSDLGVEEQKILDDLLRRQRTHATDTTTVWQTWADGLKGVVNNLDIGGKIFSGAFAPGRWKETLKGIAGDFLNVFVTPLKNWINDLVSKGLKSLADALFGIGDQVAGIFGGGSSAIGGAIGGGGGGLGSVGGAASGGVFSMVTGAITAGASVADTILSHFGRKRAEATANAIEENTRTHMLLFADFRESVGFFQNDELQRQTGNLEYIVGNTDEMKMTLWGIREALAGGVMIAGLAGGLAADVSLAKGDRDRPGRDAADGRAVAEAVADFLAPYKGETRGEQRGVAESVAAFVDGLRQPITPTRARGGQVVTPTSAGSPATPTRARGGSGPIEPIETEPGVTFGSFSVEDRQRILDLATEMGRLADIFGPGVEASAGAGLAHSQDISAFLDEIGFNDQADSLDTIGTSSEQIATLLSNPLTVESPQLNASLLMLHESLQRPIVVEIDGREIARVVGDYQAEALPYA